MARNSFNLVNALKKTKKALDCYRMCEDNLVLKLYFCFSLEVNKNKRRIVTGAIFWFKRQLLSVSLTCLVFFQGNWERIFSVFIEFSTKKYNSTSSVYVAAITWFQFNALVNLKMPFYQKGLLGYNVFCQHTHLYVFLECVRVKVGSLL